MTQARECQYYSEKGSSKGIPMYLSSDVELKGHGTVFPTILFLSDAFLLNTEADATYRRHVS